MKVEDPMTTGAAIGPAVETRGEAAELGGHRDCDGVRVASDGEPRRVVRMLIHVTFGDLVEAVASATTDPGEQVLVLDHILRRRGAKLHVRSAGVAA